ncbi:MAG: hypothetical protein M1831_005330 [Alyxoria varia]|nr:MAG: hypothetical protein M1831_005330 [Alyxoria varia]
MRGGDLLLGESYNVLRYLEAYKPNNYKRRNRNLDKPVDYIEQQMARRIYWTIFVCVRSASTFAKGASDGEEVMGPETPTRPHPPLPMEIDDEFIDHDIIHPSSKPHARITGFNKNAQIFFILDRLIATELSYGIERAYERERQKKTIVECLNDLDRVYAALPDSLAHGGDQRSTHTQDFEFGTGLKSPKSTEIETSSETSFPQQTENPLYESETNFAHIASAEGIRAERRRIATALLQVLSSSKPVFLELNSFPLCMKIRQIASTVTDFEVPENELTNEFLKILSGLEKGGALGRDDDERRSPAIWDSHTEREENELRKWADLSQNQMQYVTMDALPGPQKGKATGSEGL